MSRLLRTRTWWSALVVAFLATGLLAAPGAATPPAFTADATPLISGVAQQGGALTVVAGTYSAEPDGFDYQWYAEGDPVGTSSAVYRPSAADLGATITVQVTAHHTGDADVVTTSAPTDPVLPGGRVLAWGDENYGQLAVPNSLADKTVTAVAAGAVHALALTSDGQVTSWGGDLTVADNSVPDALDQKTVVAIAAGSYHSLALTDDGQVVAWGDDTAGKTDVPESLTGQTVVAIAAGAQHSLALTSDGQVVAWGFDDFGESTIPDGLTGKTVVAIAASGHQSLALTSDGQVFAWGSNIHGERTVPQSLTGKTVVAIAASGNHSLALTSDGKATAWGYDALGESTVPDSLADQRLVAVAAGSFDSLALTSDGRIVSWGLMPGVVPQSLTGATAVAVAGGGTFSLAIAVRLAPLATPLISGVAQQGGALTVIAGAYSAEPDSLDYQWYADGEPVGSDLPIYRPTADDLGAVITVDVTAHHAGDDDVTTTSAATGPVVEGGRVVAWGQNAYGQTDLPASLQDQTVVAISAGGYHALALTDDGRVVGFGSNTHLEATAPASLDGKTVVAVAAGVNGSLALTSDGQVTAWGSSPLTALPDSLTGQTIIDISASGYHALALTSDGRVISWGSDSDGQTEVPASLAGKNVVAVSAGGAGSLALTSDGQVTAWGAQAFGISTVPESLADKTVVAISTRGLHSLALTSQGQVVAWGYDNFGESEVPAGLTDTGAIAISGGGYQSLALTPDGHLVTWGENDFGQGTTPDGLVGKAVLAVSGGLFHNVAIAVAPPEVGAPTISGKARVDHPLTCAAPAEVADTATYTWWAGSTQVGAGATYTPGPDRVGTQVTCRINVPAPGLIDSTAEVDSAVIQPAAGGNYDVTLTGAAKVGAVLRAKISDLPADATVTWQWYRGRKAVSGATSARYDVGIDDVGARLTAVATVSEPGYRDASADAVSDPVEPRALALDVKPGKVRVGGVVHITVTNLIPGEKWTLAFGQGSWSVGGRAPLDSTTMVRRIAIPATLGFFGDRRLVITTQSPSREATTPITVLR